MRKIGERRGITLIALVITIVVLLILAGITINLTIGQDGILKRAEEAGKNYVEAAEKEKTQLAEFLKETDKIIANVTSGSVGGNTGENELEHTCIYSNEHITTPASCAETGIKTLTCECGKSKTEEIPATGKHNFKNGICVDCRAEDPNYLEAGLYDANGVMLCSWENSGIDVEKDYHTYSGSSDYYEINQASGYYVLRNKYKTATKIILPDNITNIGTSAFHGCTNLESITIPSSVESIKDNAFYGCTNLESITIPSSVENIKDNAFNGCSNLISASIGATNIGQSAFYGCSKLANVSINEGVTTIGSYAFERCKELIEITIPSSVTSIDALARDCEKLENINVVEDNIYFCSENGILFSKDMTSIYRVPENNNIVEYTIPSSVTNIEDSAFYASRKLSSVIIPENVTTIGQSAFYGCGELNNIVIPEGVTYIGGYSFYYCKKLTTLTIPKNVTHIGSWAFYGCEKLTSVIFKDSSNWYAGKYDASSYASNSSNAAKYLTNNFSNYDWDKK